MEVVEVAFTFKGKLRTTMLNNLIYGTTGKNTIETSKLVAVRV